MKDNNMKTKITILAALAVLIGTLFCSCYTPSPLYGTWSDNDGNKIQFIDDGTFSATIKDSDNQIISYSGEWSVIDNVLIFTIKGDSQYTRNTEWDIRGAMLYLTWTANNTTKILTLYHTAR